MNISVLSIITIIFTIYLTTSLHSYGSTFPFKDCEEIFDDIPFIDCDEDNNHEKISDLEDLSPDDIFAVPFP